MEGAEAPNCQPVSRHSVSPHLGTHLISAELYVRSKRTRCELARPLHDLTSRRAAAVETCSSIRVNEQFHVYNLVDWTAWLALQLEGVLCKPAEYDVAVRNGSGARVEELYHRRQVQA